MWLSWGLRFSCLRLSGLFYLTNYLWSRLGHWLGSCLWWRHWSRLRCCLLSCLWGDLLSSQMNSLWSCLCNWLRGWLHNCWNSLLNNLWSLNNFWSGYRLRSHGSNWLRLWLSWNLLDRLLCWHGSFSFNYSLLYWLHCHFCNWLLNCLFHYNWCWFRRCYLDLLGY